jgi:probable rRNA maturation factor
MPVHLIDNQPTPLIRARTMRARAERLLSALSLEDSELSLLLTGDEEIHALNKSWRKKDAPTDVLSFPQDEEGLLGDVVISTETAARQAGDPGGWARDHAGARGDSWSALDEATLLLIHGVLHLLGHDHHKAGEAKKMRAEETRLFPLVARRR